MEPTRHIMHGAFCAIEGNGIWQKPTEPTGMLRKKEKNMKEHDGSTKNVPEQTRRTWNDTEPTLSKQIPAEICFSSVPRWAATSHTPANSNWNKRSQANASTDAQCMNTTNEWQDVTNASQMDWEMGKHLQAVEAEQALTEHRALICKTWLTRRAVIGK